MSWRVSVFQGSKQHSNMHDELPPPANERWVEAGARSPAPSPTTQGTGGNKNLPIFYFSIIHIIKQRGKNRRNVSKTSIMSLSRRPPKSSNFKKIEFSSPIFYFSFSRWKSELIVARRSLNSLSCVHALYQKKRGGGQVPMITLIEAEQKRITNSGITSLKYVRACACFRHGEGLEYWTPACPRSPVPYGHLCCCKTYKPTIIAQVLSSSTWIPCSPSTCIINPGNVSCGAWGRAVPFV